VPGTHVATLSRPAKLRSLRKCSPDDVRFLGYVKEPPTPWIPSLAEVSGGKLGIQGVRGQLVGGDPDMVADLVEGLLCHWRRRAVFPGVSVLVEAVVGVCEACVVMLAELVDCSSGAGGWEGRLLFSTRYTLRI
jgi:hypothetical protein